MKVVVIGMDPQVLEHAAASVRVRWPNATLKYAVNAKKGLELAEQEWPRLVVLSNVQDSGHYEFVQKLRNFSNVPLLLLGQTGDDMEVVACLEAGADDYVQLPCDLPELTVRLGALVRRANYINSYEREVPLASGELMVNPASNKAYMGEERLSLTNTEFQMLFLLVRNWRIVIPRQTLEQNLWPGHFDSRVLIKRYVHRLRVKLRDDPRKPLWVANVYGVGYRFVGPEPKLFEFPSTR